MSASTTIIRGQFCASQLFFYLYSNIRVFVAAWTK